MTGRYLIPFCKKPFYVLTHSYPFRQLRWHFPRQAGTAYVSYSFLLQQNKRGQLTFPVLFFLGEKSFTTSRKRNPLVPSFLSGGKIRNDDGRKEYNLTLSEESGIGYRKTHLISPTFAWILHSTPYFFIIIFPTAFYDRSRMTGRYLNAIHSCRHSWAAGRFGMMIEEKT